MSTKSRNVLVTVIIIIIAIVIAALSIGSYLWGKRSTEDKYKKQTLEIDVRMDSLLRREIALQDSLNLLRKQRNQITVVRTVFKTVYDTVQIKTVPTQVVDGLNFVVTHPIPPQ